MNCIFLQCTVDIHSAYRTSPAAEFLDVIGTKVLLFTVTSSNGFYFPTTLRKSGLKLVCNVNIVNENLKSENSQDYVQKPQRNCTFMKSASVGLVNFSSWLTVATIALVVAVKWLVGAMQRVLEIYRGPGLLAVVWFGSYSPASHSSPSVSSTDDTEEGWERETTFSRGKGGGGWARSRCIRPQESLVLYKSFNTFWGDVWADRDVITELQGRVEHSID
jgi:hypothetical protein